MKIRFSKMLLCCAFMLTSCSDGHEVLAETTQTVSDSQNGTVVREVPAA